MLSVATKIVAPLAKSSFEQVVGNNNYVFPYSKPEAF